MVHDLKIESEYFEQVANGSKTFEIRLNDRHFRVGDDVMLREYDGCYTGGVVWKTIGYITEYNQLPGYVVFSLI